MTDSTRKMKKTDLVLSNGEYAFTQDTTTGSVKVLTGPTVLNITGQEYPVVYDAEQRRFRPVDLEEATQQCPLAPQGYYIELWNPPESSPAPQPSEGSKENPPRLSMGQRVNIPGPATFALWPQQYATVISGHHLRTNQYLVARVYDEEAAKENWKKTVLKSASGPAAEGGGSAPSSPGGEGRIAELTEDDLTVGKQFIIKGTEVSFYMPPTGVEVVPDEEGRYLREALTLERLQYCILVDENGDKDYQRGPQVVFPRPTQRFYRDGGGGGVFRPTELNPIQGIHVKVIAPYSEGERRYAEGEELFITGRDTPIYFPRPEHALVNYDGSAKHFATAVPEGEARYVMDRNTGEIRMVRGPTMLLCDPRTEVVVRRVLTEHQCALWYPGNEEAKAYNAALGALLPRRPSTRASVSEGEVRRSLKKDKATVKPEGKSGGRDRSSVHSGSTGPFADEWQRVATYSQPRTLTLDTKYSGVPTVSVWDGHAVMVVDKRGDRRVEIGPKDVLLEYDQTLQEVELSAGVPKSATDTRRQVYLRLVDNRIEDEFDVVTVDHVGLSLRLALSADFVGSDPARWFSTGNFVQRICDRVRRAVQDAVRAATIDAFYDEPLALVRAAVLGGVEGSSGVDLDDLGLALRQVEVLGCTIANARLAQQVEEARAYVVASRYGLERMARKLELDRSRMAMEREQAGEEDKTARFRAELEAEAIRRAQALHEARLEAAVAKLAKQLDERVAAERLADEEASRRLARRRQEADAEREIGLAELELRLTELSATTDAAVARFKAAEGPVAEAIQLLGNQDILAKVAEATSAQRLFGGKDVVDVVGQLFAGTSLAQVFDRVQQRSIPRVVAGVNQAEGSAEP